MKKIVDEDGQIETRPNTTKEWENYLRYLLQRRQNLNKIIALARYNLARTKLKNITQVKPKQKFQNLTEAMEFIDKQREKKRTLKDNNLTNPILSRRRLLD